nr:insulinase family protein [Phycicoccus sp.]
LKPIALPPDPTPAPLPPLAAPAEVEVRRAVPNNRLHIAFRLPVDGTADFHATALAMDAIGGLASSRLGRRLVRAEQSALNVNATAWGFIGGNSLGFIAADISPESTLDHVESVVLEELERFAHEGPTQGELEASLAQTERGWLQALASQEERADLISQRALLSGDPTLVNTFLDELRAVTAADIQGAAATWLQPEARATIRYRKTDGQEAA